MATTGDQDAACEGCGKTVGLDELRAVQLPSGETVACCPTCLEHARAAAEKSTSLAKRRKRCDGCTAQFLESELQSVTLPDGVTIDCCPDCADTLPRSGRDEDDAETEASAEADDGIRDESVKTEPSTDSDEEAEQTLCKQCNEWVTEELFEVTTIDGRTERFCSTCKERAERDGIIKDVEMRNSRAREILGVEAGASTETIREAYHANIKRAHPDQNSGSRSAFQLVTEAYERLTESE